MENQEILWMEIQKSNGKSLVALSYAFVGKYIL